MDKLYYYKPMDNYSTVDDPPGFVEQLDGAVFIVADISCATFHENSLYEILIKFVSGDKDKWDKLGHINRTFADSRELTELSSIETILIKTAE